MNGILLNYLKGIFWLGVKFKEAENDVKTSNRTWPFTHENIFPFSRSATFQSLTAHAPVSTFGYLFAKCFFHRVQRKTISPQSLAENFRRRIFFMTWCHGQHVLILCLSLSMIPLSFLLLSLLLSHSSKTNSKGFVLTQNWKSFRIVYSWVNRVRE
jgi:hypothetical protein